MEVRHKIRKARHPTGPESEKSPSEPFENPALESEVFFKASFLAQNEAEEQKNQVSHESVPAVAHLFAHLLKATFLNLLRNFCVTIVYERSNYSDSHGFVLHNFTSAT